MARPPQHTDEDILQQIDDLAAAHEGELTLDMIRQHVGGGSDRLARLFREWLRRNQKLAEIRSRLSARDLRAIERAGCIIAESIESRSLAASEALRQVHEAQLIELRTELETTNEELDAARNDIASLQDRFENSEASRYQSEGREAELRAQLERLTNGVHSTRAA
ncbi:MAG: hypothetical protein CMH65_06735 [Nevskiales bacterium]|nr:hypothetical protein [Nevskiales bacterium]